MANKYQRFGLRADRNLADLPNPTRALDNILEDLVVSQTDKFSAADLLVISGLKDTRVTTSKLAQINDVLPSYTPTTGAVNQVVQPYVTIKDQIENFKVIAGDPPFLSGGLGPVAHKYSSQAFDFQSTLGGLAQGSSSYFPVEVEDVRGNANEDNTRGPLDFWQGGTFRQSNKFNVGFPDQFGSVVWEGWTSVNGFEIDTNGCLIIEQDVYGTGDWETIVNVNYYKIRETGNGTNFEIVPGSETYVNFPDADVTAPKRYFEGMRVWFELSDGSYLSDEGKIIAGVSRGYNSGTGIRYVIAEDLTTLLSGATIVAIHIGFEPDVDTYTTDSLAFTQRYTGKYTKFKIAWYYPLLDNNLSFATSGLDNKVFEMRFGPQDTIEYWFFYPTDPEATSGRKYSYEQFLTDRISPTVKVSNFDINNSESFLFDYTPPATTSDCVISTSVTNTSAFDQTASNVGTKRLLQLSSGAFDFIEEGDYVVYQDSSNEDTIAQAYKIDGARVFLNPDPVVEYGGLPASDEVMFISRQGLVGIYAGSGFISDQLTISSVAGLNGSLFNTRHIAKGMIVCMVNRTSYNGQPIGMWYVKDIISYGTSTMTVQLVELYSSESVGHADSIVAVYASKGLHDNSSPQQCIGVIGAEVATAQSGTSLTLTQTAGELGLTTGDYIQFGSDPSSATYSSQYVPNDTTVTVSAGSATVTLSNTGSLAIPASATVIFIKQGNYQSGVPKEFCVVPLNTAPPFESTDTGLQTPNGYGLKADSIEFRNVELTTSSSISLTSVVNADGFLPLYHGSTRYKLLTNSNG